jgi:hypothetical protein
MIWSKSMGVLIVMIGGYAKSSVVVVAGVVVGKFEA